MAAALRAWRPPSLLVKTAEVRSANQEQSIALDFWLRLAARQWLKKAHLQAAPACCNRIFCLISCTADNARHRRCAAWGKGQLSQLQSCAAPLCPSSTAPQNATRYTGAENVRFKAAQKKKQCGPPNGEQALCSCAAMWSITHVQMITMIATKAEIRAGEFNLGSADSMNETWRSSGHQFWRSSGNKLNELWK